MHKCIWGKFICNLKLRFLGLLGHLVARKPLNFCRIRCDEECLSNNCTNHSSTPDNNLSLCRHLVKIKTGETSVLCSVSDLPFMSAKIWICAYRFKLSHWPLAILYLCSFESFCCSQNEIICMLFASMAWRVVSLFLCAGVFEQQYTLFRFY